MKLELHKNLKLLLENKGMSASQLARATKVPNSTVANWLAGLEPRNLIQLKKVAEYFETSVDNLLYEAKKGKSKELPTLSEYADEINAGTFEVVLRRIRK